MPTAAKLVAALAFALVGYFAANAVKPVMPEGTQFGWFSELTAGIGLLCGWIVMGGLTGRSYGEAAASGVRVSATIVFWALLGFSIYEMVLRSTKLRYDGPMEALLAVFALMLDYGSYLGTAAIIGILAVGGVVAGIAAEWAGRRWQ
jgi:hypothetical protein